jgi:hypothetical protein
MDRARARGAVSGPPANYLSYGIVGHVDQSPMWAWIEGNQALVEVTLVPSGDEIVARIPCGGGDGQAFYLPLAYGSRVIVGMPGGSGSEPVIHGSVNDATWPFPDGVCGITMVPVAAPQFAFLRTADGHLLAIETGDGGDIMIHSGASVEVKVNAGEQILLGGRTHIGARFTAPPIGAAAGPNGETLSGVQGLAHVPLPHVPLPIEPVALPPFIGPADGIVRAKDPVQSDAATDPVFWTWLLAIHAINAPLLAALPTPILNPPLAIGSAHKGASQHTASDS